MRKVRRVLQSGFLIVALGLAAGCDGDEAVSIVVGPKTPPATATSTATATVPLPTSTSTGTRAANTATQTATQSPTNPLPTGTPTLDPAAHTPTPTATATEGAPTATPTTTATATPTGTETPSGGVALGVRQLNVVRPGSHFNSSALAGFDVSIDPWLPGPLLLEAGAPDGSGVATLKLAQDVVLGWVVLDNSVACMKFFAAESQGSVACNGGVPQSVLVTQDSNGDMNPGPLMTLTGQGNPSPPGSASFTAQRSVVNLPAGSAPTECSTASFTVLEPAAFTTDAGTGMVFNAVQSGLTITLSANGEPFDCSTWTNPNGPGKLVDPVIGLDVEPVGDVVNALVIAGQPE